MRINEISNLIDNANVCVDVGSDHAYLSIELIKNQKTKVVYNLEKNLGPFNNSVKNTKDYPDKIFNILSDGFKFFNENIEIDYCIISGMGGNTITSILNGIKNKINALVLCPNNNSYLIRKWAKQNKWKIYLEKTIIDNGIYYEIICLSKNKGIKIFLKNQLFFGSRKLKKNDCLYIDKLKNELEKSNYLILKQKNKSKYRMYKKIKKYINKYDNC